MDVQIGLPEQPIFSVGELNQKIVVIANDLTGKFVTAGFWPEASLSITGDRIDRFTSFQFVAHLGGYYKIYCPAHKSFCSAFGKDWPLQPRVADEQWSHFDVTMDASGAITIESTASIARAANCSFLSLPSNYDVDKSLRVCEAKPVPVRGTFHAYELGAFPGVDPYQALSS